MNIQLGRYSFLGAGVLYGTYNQGRLEKVEAKARVIAAAKKEKRDIQLAGEKKRNADGSSYHDCKLCLILTPLLSFVISS